MAETIWTLVLLHGTVAFFVAGHALLRRKEPLATLAWLQAIVLVPGLGVFLYLIFGADTIYRRRYRRRRALLGDYAALLAPRESVIADHLAPEPPEEFSATARETLAVALRTSERLPTRGNAIRVFDNVSAFYDNLEVAIRGASRHVHLEYYIFQPDATGRRFLDLLARKAALGVEVRLLLDGLGSRKIGRSHLAPLLRAGGRVGWFLPLEPYSPRPVLHLRNHRKLTVVDGRIAFTGGVNIGDEYRGRRAHRPAWRDTHMRVEGPAVHHLHEVFAEDWHFTTGEHLLRWDYFPPHRTAGDAVVHVVASGPDDPARAIHATLFHAISSARHRIWIATPYFAPDGAILAALMSSAYRGVDVQLLIPRRTDHPLVDRAGESFLPELLDAGVKVFRYEAGMLHSKLVAIDGQWGTLGSANMDMRSFRSNFEVNLLVFSPTVAERLEAIYQKDLMLSSPYTRAHADSTPLHRRITTALCRLLAPAL